MARNAPPNRQQLADARIRDTLMGKDALDVAEELLGLVRAEFRLNIELDDSPDRNTNRRAIDRHRAVSALMVTSGV
jgi:hypothetical protein